MLVNVRLNLIINHRPADVTFSEPYNNATHLSVAGLMFVLMYMYRSDRECIKQFSERRWTVNIGVDLAGILGDA